MGGPENPWLENTGGNSRRIATSERYTKRCDDRLNPPFTVSYIPDGAALQNSDDLLFGKPAALHEPPVIPEWSGDQRLVQGASHTDQRVVLCGASSETCALPVRVRSLS